MTWETAMTYAWVKASLTGKRYYVRGYIRTVTRQGEWLYGVYRDPEPRINSPINDRWLYR